MDKKVDATGPDKDPKPQPNKKLLDESSELLASGAKPAERKDTSNLHAMELTDDKNAARKASLREKSQRNDGPKKDSPNKE